MTAVQPQCKGCQAPVIWARNRADGKPVMLDKARDLSDTSLYAVERDTHLVLHVRVLLPGEQPRPGVEHRHQAHRDTCTARAAADD